jgi:aryl-alcohol dehydrogenase-like predicted oxidoreductase
MVMHWSRQAPEGKVIKRVNRRLLAVLRLQPGPGESSLRRFAIACRSHHRIVDTFRFVTSEYEFTLCKAMFVTRLTQGADAAASGQFKIGGDIAINRLGFGAMRITGRGIWGEPEDSAAARDTLKALPHLGVNFIDTADSYGPSVSEALIGEVLYPYEGLSIATKGGLTRQGPDAWSQDGRPASLRAALEGSLKRLKLERIDLWQLHRIDSKVPRDEQLDAVAAMQKEGLIRHVGLSEVTVDDIQTAGKYFDVATVQNLYNLGNRRSEAVLEYCHAHNIGFIPWYPLAAGTLDAPGSALNLIATKLGATTGQVALAWLLRRSPVMLPIPGTGKPAHLLENVAAADIALSDEDFAILEKAAK